MNKNFSHLIKNLLKEKGWTQTDLSERSHIDKSTINRYIKGNRGVRPKSAHTEAMAKAFNIDEGLFYIATGQIPDELYLNLCAKYPTKTLSSLRQLEANLTKKSDKSIERLARDVLFSYLKIVGRENFTYPLDIRDLVEKIYGLKTLEKSFNELEIHTKDDETLCGLLVPDHAEIGRGYFNHLILLNSDLLDKSKNGEEIGRFTIAHEAFHQEMWQLSQETKDSHNYIDGNIIYCRTREIRTETESKANHFAGAILMPRKDILKEINKYPIPFDFRLYSDILQKRYGVTKSALRTRLRVLKVSFIEKSYPDGQQLPLFSL